MHNTKTELVSHLKYLTKIQERLVIEDNTVKKLSKNPTLKNHSQKNNQKIKPQRLYWKNKSSFVLGEQI